MTTRQKAREAAWAEATRVITPARERERRVPLNWAAEANAIGAPKAWSAELVKIRLETSIAVIMATAGRVGPRGFGSAMPRVLHEWADILEWPEADQIEEARIEKGRRGRLQIFPIDVRRSDAAVGWPGAYLRAHDDLRAALMLWIRSKALRKPLGYLLAGSGLSRATADRKRDQAFRMIAEGLNRDGVETA